MPLMPCRNESFGRTYFFWGPPLSGPGFTTWSIRPRVFWRVVSEKDGKEWMTMNPKKHISSIGETKAAILWVITPKWFPASYFSGSSSNNTFLWVTICKFPPKTWKTLFCDMVFKENYYIHLPIINGPQVFPLGNFFFGGAFIIFQIIGFQNAHLCHSTCIDLQDARVAKGPFLLPKGARGQRHGNSPPNGAVTSWTLVMNAVFVWGWHILCQ